MREMLVEKFEQGWVVHGEGIFATVHGSTKYGPNGYMTGKGTKKFRTAILEAVEKFRNQPKGE